MPSRYLALAGQPVITIYQWSICTTRRACGVAPAALSGLWQLQAYGRAIELEPKRLFSLVQSGLVLLALGNYTEAQGLVQAALEADPQHVSALFAAAQLLLASAKYRIAQGTPGM